jgi:hypothetical protein
VSTRRCSPPQVYCSGTRVWRDWSKTKADYNRAAGSTCARFGLGVSELRHRRPSADQKIRSLITLQAIFARIINGFQIRRSSAPPQLDRKIAQGDLQLAPSNAR